MHLEHGAAAEILASAQSNQLPYHAGLLSRLLAGDTLDVGHTSLEAQRPPTGAPAPSAPQRLTPSSPRVPPSSSKPQRILPKPAPALRPVPLLPEPTVTSPEDLVTHETKCGPEFSATQVCDPSDMFCKASNFTCCVPLAGSDYCPGKVLQVPESGRGALAMACMQQRTYCSLGDEGACQQQHTVCRMAREAWMA